MNSECDNIEEKIADLISGTLSETQVQTVEQHLEACSSCRDYARALKHEDGLLTEFFAQIDTDMTGRQERALNAINRSLASEQSDSLSIRRIIMKSRITRSAAAAIIIFVGLLLLSYFTGSTNIVPAAFAQVVEAVKKESWMHSTTTFSKPEETGVWERWISFESQVEIDIKSDGKVIFDDYPKQKTYVYNPSTEVITVRTSLYDTVANGASGPLELFEKLIQIQVDKGAEIDHKKTKGTEIYKIMTHVDKGVEVVELKVDLETYLPVALEVRLRGHDGQLLYSVSVNFDYPESGPKNIYEVGVPKSAKIIVNGTQ